MAKDLWIAFGSRYTTRAPFFLPSSRVDLLKGPHLIDPGDPATCLDVCGINRATPGDLCTRLAGMKRAAKVEEFFGIRCGPGLATMREDVARRPRTRKSRLSQDLTCEIDRPIDRINPYQQKTRFPQENDLFLVHLRMLTIRPTCYKASIV